jgi:hypothetical protein
VTTAVLLGLSLMARPQGAPPPQEAPPPAVQQAPPVPVAGLRQELDHRHDQIGMMEAMLAQAVRKGAVRAGNDLAPNLPGTLTLTGQARARGFILEGYGVFFDVEIPSLLKSVVWSMQNMERDLQNATQTLQSLRDVVDSLPSGNPKRQEYLKALRQLEQQTGPAPERAAASVRAADTGEIEVPGNDPDALYARSVIASCVDAMLDYSKPMDMQPDEWLIVALRGSEGQTAPTDLTEVRTVQLRVKGSDLTDFLAGRLSRDDVRKKVIVRQF